MKYLGVALFLGSMIAAAGCGSDGADCNSASKKLCAKACACTEDGDKCAIGGGGATITFDNEAGCVALYSAGCGGAGNANIVWATCEKDLDTAACTADMNGQKALTPPASCDSN